VRKHVSDGIIRYIAGALTDYTIYIAGALTDDSRLPAKKGDELPALPPDNVFLDRVHGWQVSRFFNARKHASY
jgi:hypothetical protein